MFLKKGGVEIATFSISQQERDKTGWKYDGDPCINNKYRGISTSTSRDDICSGLLCLSILSWRPFAAALAPDMRQAKARLLERLYNRACQTLIESNPDAEGGFVRKGKRNFEQVAAVAVTSGFVDGGKGWAVATMELPATSFEPP
nr:hypothetical protein Iba_chr09fCG11420 [Ipomoea batatas]